MKSPWTRVFDRTVKIPTRDRNGHQAALGNGQERANKKSPARIEPSGAEEGD
jgi:hypothetical protein